MKPITEYTEKTKSYDELINILQKNNNLNQLGEIRKNLAILAQNQESLVKLNAYCIKDFSQTYKDKDRTKNVLIPNLLKIGGLLILASDNPKKIEKKIDKISNLLDDISDKKLLKYTQKIISKSYNLLGNSFISDDKWSFKKAKKSIKKADLIIENYGLTMEMVKDLEEAGMSYLRYMVTIDAIKKKREKAVDKITEIIEQNDKILGQRIDPLVNSYEKQDSTFYSQYFKLRNQTEEEKITDVSNAQLS